MNGNDDFEDSASELFPKNRLAYSSADKRRQIIYDLLCRDGRVEISQLCEVLGVSEMTVRRNLQQMADEGLLARVHGGAVMEKRWERERSFRMREIDRLDVKKKIAETAVSYIEKGQSIYLDGGTTCYEIAKRLPIDYNLTVITDSVAVLLELRERKRIEIILMGGQLSSDGNSLDGMLTAECAEKLSVEWCICSVGGFSTQALGNPGLIGTLTKKIMIRRAMRTLIVADSNKYNKHFLYDLCGWEAVDHFLTDDGIDQNMAAELEKYDTQLRLVRIDQAIRAQTPSPPRPE